MSTLPEGIVNVTIRISETLRLRLEARGWQRHARTGEAVSISKEIRLCLEENIPDLDPVTCPPRILKAFEEAKKRLTNQSNKG